MSALPTPTSLESFLSIVRGFQANPAAAGPDGGHAAGAGELPDFAWKSLELLSRNNLANLFNALDTLDGTQHSIGVAVILTAILKQHQQITEFDNVFIRISVFIAECNAEQVRYGAGSFAEMCHHFTDELVTSEASPAYLQDSQMRLFF